MVSGRTPKEEACGVLVRKTKCLSNKIHTKRISRWARGLIWLLKSVGLKLVKTGESVILRAQGAANRSHSMTKTFPIKTHSLWKKSKMTPEQAVVG